MTTYNDTTTFRFTVTDVEGGNGPTFEADGPTWWEAAPKAVRQAEEAGFPVLDVLEQGSRFLLVTTTDAP